MKHCCRNCQFLTKTTSIPGGGEEYRLSWREGDFSSFELGEQWTAECSQGIWSAGIAPELKSQLKDVVLQDRKDRCFFVERHEGMSTQGALALHKLRNDNRQLKKGYRYTQIALGIATLSLLTNLVYNIIKDFVFR